MYRVEVKIYFLCLFNEDGGVELTLGFFRILESSCCRCCCNRSFKSAFAPLE